MSSRNNKQKRYYFVAAPVFLIIAGACILSIAAIIENIRFVHATNQILSLVNTVRAQAASRKTFALNTGENVWDDLANIGEAPQASMHPNPWGNDIKAVIVPSAMRIESDLPGHDCARMARYFLEQPPAEIGLVGVEVQPAKNPQWAVLYPQTAVSSPNIATTCSKGGATRLALIFKVR